HRGDGGPERAAAEHPHDDQREAREQERRDAVVHFEPRRRRLGSGAKPSVQQKVVERDRASVPRAGRHTFLHRADDLAPSRLLRGPQVHQLVPPQARRCKVHDPGKAAGNDDPGEQPQLACAHACVHSACVHRRTPAAPATRRSGSACARLARGALHTGRAGARNGIPGGSEMLEGSSSSAKRVETRPEVVIRFAGDSGDGMQVTGVQFTTESALAGNDLATLPDFPAEIRAPAGTLAGVSAFQLNFSAHEVFTPGDDLDVLVAMNPAALKANLDDLKPGGTLIVDREGFNEQNLKRAGFETSPLADGSLKAKSQLFPIDVAKLTQAALKDLSLSAREVFRCRNFLCLGIVSWLYHRPLEPAEAFIKSRFKKNPLFVEANTRVLKAGYNFAETTELFAVS